MAADFTEQQVFLLHRVACEVVDLFENPTAEASDVQESIDALRKAGWTPSHLGAARFNRDGVATSCD